MNQCAHEAVCRNCGEPVRCDNPECRTLAPHTTVCGACYTKSIRRVKKQTKGARILF